MDGRRGEGGGGRGGGGGDPMGFMCVGDNRFIVVNV